MWLDVGVVRWSLGADFSRNRYFCRPYIEGYFLEDPAHAKYINKEALEKYWDVGGVRIEDDILVTEDGYENLTTAPKGEEMLEIINQGDEDEAM